MKTCKRCSNLAADQKLVCDECSGKLKIIQQRYHDKHKKDPKYKSRIKKNTKKWLAKSPWAKLLISCRKRSKELKLNYNLDTAHLKKIYIEANGICPVLKIQFDKTNLSTTPSVDRIIPELGYVKGNVRIISHRANMLKSNATIDEMKLIFEDLIKLQNQ